MMNIGPDMMDVNAKSAGFISGFCSRGGECLVIKFLEGCQCLFQDIAQEGANV